MPREKNPSLFAARLPALCGRYPHLRPSGLHRRPWSASRRGRPAQLRPVRRPHREPDRAARLASGAALCADAKRDHRLRGPRGLVSLPATQHPGTARPPRRAAARGGRRRHRAFGPGTRRPRPAPPARLAAPGGKLGASGWWVAEYHREGATMPCLGQWPPQPGLSSFPRRTTARGASLKGGPARWQAGPAKTLHAARISVGRFCQLGSGIAPRAQVDNDYPSLGAPSAPASGHRPRPPAPPPPPPGLTPDSSTAARTRGPGARTKAPPRSALGASPTAVGERLAARTD